MGPDVADQLRHEIAKWTDRLDAEIPKAKPRTARGEKFLENLRAYRSDSVHFLKNDDLVRSFESVVWAWAWLEIGGETEDLDWAYPEDG